MPGAEQIDQEIRSAVAQDNYRWALDVLVDYALPVAQDMAKETMRARKAMSQDPVDTLTLSNKLVELSILNQRMGERVSLMGYIVRAADEWYHRIRENHKVRLVIKGEARQTTETDAKGKEKIVTKYVTMAGGVADSMKLELAHQEFALYNECQLVMDKLLSTRRSTEKTLDNLRTKISFEKGDQRNVQ